MDPTDGLHVVPGGGSLKLWGAHGLCGGSRAREGARVLDIRVTCAGEGHMYKIRCSSSRNTQAFF